MRRLLWLLGLLAMSATLIGCASSGARPYSGAYGGVSGGYGAANNAL